MLFFLIKDLHLFIFRVSAHSFLSHHILFNLDIELITSNYFTSVSCTCIKYQQGNK